MTESKLQGKVVTLLAREGAYVFKVISASRSGVPDVIALLLGTFLGVECKSDAGAVAKLQAVNGRRIIAAGGRFFVVRPKTFCAFKSEVRKIAESNNTTRKARRP